MGQLGHADAGFTLRVYAKQMDRRDGEPERLKTLAAGGIVGPTEKIDLKIGAALSADC
jgi:hypothetical protein